MRHILIIRIHRLPPWYEEVPPVNAIEPKLFYENNFVKPMLTQKVPEFKFMFKIIYTHKKRELILVGDVTSDHIISVL
jgi:hypothetical protein